MKNRMLLVVAGFVAAMAFGGMSVPMGEEGCVTGTHSTASHSTTGCGPTDGT